MTFRPELRDWLSAHVTPEVVEAGRRPVTAGTLEPLHAWNRELTDAGWAAPAWPVEHGGRAAGLDEQVAYHEEMDAAGAPGPINVIGVSNIAPAIMAYGTEKQKTRFLRPMLRGDEIWSQGMSEPDAGSDLASLRTRAVLEGDGFVVNGQKTWNSLGHLADWCQLYVRTDPDAPKHQGISCLLVDLRTPGIEVRPLRTMTGEVSFSELFFSDVRVPRDALLGPLHKGWMTGRSLAQLGLGEPTGTAGSLAKLAWSRADQALAELALDLLGPSSSLWGEWARNLAASRSTSIAGGTTEINRDIVAEHGLGLPRD